MGNFGCTVKMTFLRSISTNQTQDFQRDQSVPIKRKTIFFPAVIFQDIDIFYNEKVMISYFLCMNCGTRTIFKICYVSQLLFKIKKGARVRVWWTKNALFFAPCTFKKKNKNCKVKINKRFLVINEIKHHNKRPTKYLVKLLSQTKTKILHGP